MVKENYTIELVGVIENIVDTVDRRKQSSMTILRISIDKAWSGQDALIEGALSKRSEIEVTITEEAQPELREQIEQGYEIGDKVFAKGIATIDAYDAAGNEPIKMLGTLVVKLQGVER